jgi:hypothetical protein
MKTFTLAATAIVALTLTLSGCSALDSVTDLLGDDSGVVEGEGEAQDVFTIVVGDCINDAAAEGEISSVPTVDCSEPHDSEAYLAFDMEGDVLFPGDDTVQAAADKGCGEAFEAFVGIPYDESLVDYGYYFPSEGTWLTGDREIVCLAYETDEDGNDIQTTGSLKGSKR